MLNKKYYIVLALIIIGFIANTISYSIIDDKVNNELKDKAKIISNKKVTQFHIGILNEEDTLNSIMENKTFINYIENQKNQKDIEELFISLSKAHKYVFQIRYIDISGQEIIRVDKDFQNRTHLVTKENLQNKKDRYYFQDTLKQEQNKIWYSKIDLNIEHGEIEKPIKPTIRIGLPVYSKDKKEGILIFNIAVKDIFHQIKKDLIFNVFIVDKDGEYLYHKNRNYRWSRYLKNKQSILNNYDGFEKEYLKENTKYYNGLYLQKLYLENGEDLLLVLDPKKRTVDRRFNSYYSVFLMYMVFILILIFLIILIVFAAKEHKMKEKLLNNEKMASMGEMIGNIAHQWRQPLSVISTASTGMKMQKEFGALSDEQFNKNCDLINDNAQYLSQTINDFRNFIKGDRTKSLFNLKDDIDSFLHLVEGSIKRHNINMVLDIQEDIEIDGYKNELIQCFINIFNNAKDALKENNNQDNRVIIISTYIDHKNAIIKLKDNAGGIPKDIISNIFEPYFTTKHKSQGTGLGLHMTYNLIVDGMGGTVEASNKTYFHKGKEYIGAEFKIILPI